MTDSTPPSLVPSRVPSPYLRVDNAARAIDFYRVVFGAVEVVRMVEPSGRVAHAELRFGVDGAACVMLSDEYPEYGLLGPVKLGGNAIALQLYVEDVDAVCALAEQAGASIVRPAALDPFGDRVAKLIDVCGHEWMIATRVETISPAEMQRRFQQLFDVGSTEQSST